MTANLWLCHAITKSAGKTNLHGVPIESVGRGQKFIMEIEMYWLGMSGATANGCGSGTGYFKARLGRK